MIGQKKTSCVKTSSRTGQYSLYRPDLRHAIQAVLLLGIVLRIIYMLATDSGTRTYDVYRDSWGHMDYIRYIAETGALPPTNECQAYHPPLHHALMAIALNAAKLITLNEAAQIKATQFATAFISSLTLIFLYKILNALELSPGGMLTGVSFFAFHPTNIYFASRINNDGTMLFFYTLAFFYLIKWIKNPSWRNIVYLSLFSSLAALTKFSGVMLFPLIAAAFGIAALYKIRPFGMLARQFALCAGIFFPVSISYQLRNYILFHQPLGYVPSFGAGFQPTLLNLFKIPVENILDSPFNHGGLKGGEFFLEFLFKSSLFGEWEFPGLEPAAYTLLISAALVAILFLMQMLSHAGDLVSRTDILFLLNLLIPLILAAKFRFDFPVACSQDFRYVAPILISVAYFLGKFHRKPHRTVYRILKPAVAGTVGIFCVSSAIWILFLSL